MSLQVIGKATIDMEKFRAFRKEERVSCGAFGRAGAARLRCARLSAPRKTVPHGRALFFAGYGAEDTADRSVLRTVARAVSHRRLCHARRGGGVHARAPRAHIRRRGEDRCGYCGRGNDPPRVRRRVRAQVRGARRAAAGVTAAEAERRGCPRQRGVAPSFCFALRFILKKIFFCSSV